MVIHVYNHINNIFLLRVWKIAYMSLLSWETTYLHSCLWQHIVLTSSSDNTLLVYCLNLYMMHVGFAKVGDVTDPAGLTLNWGRGKMATTSQTTFSNALSWMKKSEFVVKFHWNLFPVVRLTIQTAYVHIIAWRRAGDKPLSEPNVVYLIDASVS